MANPKHCKRPSLLVEAITFGAGWAVLIGIDPAVFFGLDLALHSALFGATTGCVCAATSRYWRERRNPND
jgi:hypothetical protein